MIEIEFNIRVDRDNPQDAPWLDESEMAMMLDYTKQQIRQHVQNTLGDLRCEEHGGAPRVIVSGAYSLETEQLELSYHIDTCCPMLLMRAVAALNH